MGVRFLASVVILALLVALDQPVAAQSQSSVDHLKLVPRTKEEREQNDRALRRIILNVQVTDTSGAVVRDLRTSDFAIFEDGVEQKMVQWRMAGGSATSDHLLLVLDAWNSSAGALETAKKDIERYLREQPATLSHPVSLVLVSAFGAQMSQSSNSKEVLLADLRRMAKDARPGACGRGAANDPAVGVDMSGIVTMTAMQPPPRSDAPADCLAQHLTLSLSVLGSIAKEQKEAQGRALVVWIGQGWPSLAEPEFVRTSKEIRQGDYAYLAELMIALREAQVTLDVVSWTDPGVNEAVHNREAQGKADGANSDPANDETYSLPSLARRTGGRIFENSKHMTADIDRCASDVDAYYVLSFDSAPAAQPNEYRSLAVKVKRSDLVARTLPGYFPQF